MKKMQNNGGFALVETLIGALFVVVIFTVLFENYYPLIGNYERYENYDDLDSKYVAHYLREMISVDPNKSEVFSKLTSASGKSYVIFDEGESDENITNTATPNELCTLLSVRDAFNNKQYCQNFIEQANINRIYLTSYNTTSFKNYVKDHARDVNDEGEEEISRAFELYVQYLPTFKILAEKKSGYYRIIVEIKHENTDSDKENDFYYTYANIEVK